MKAVVITAYGGPEALALAERPDPAPKPGMVRIAVKAFGLNHAEAYFRAGAWGDVAEISGIECVGEVIEDPQGALSPGQAVFALMGGLGRTLNGSYAEQVNAPAANVVPIQTRGLSWEALAAIPETYATAWTCLNANLALQKGQALVVRGGTSALGLAAINLAVRAGAQVIATSRRPERAASIEVLGACLRAGDAGPRAAASDRPSRRRRCGARPDRRVDPARLDGHGPTRRARVRGGLPRRAGADDGVRPGLADEGRRAPQRVRQRPRLWLADLPAVRNPLPGTSSMRPRRAALRAGPVKVFAMSELADAHRAIEAASLGGKAVVRVAEA